MPSLSTPIGELQAHYGVVVVGSGYGASVAAYRMAALAAERAKVGPTFSVCVLERGLEIPAGDYPSSLTQVARQIQVDTSSGHIGSATALFDLRLNDDVSALVGCGLGGGSLINAGVMLPPQPEVFDDGWPSVFRTENLAPYFDQVRATLSVARLPKDIELLKVSRLFEAAGTTPEERFKSRPQIAVSFETKVNPYGVQQKACVLCGDCMTGCNHSAKNTLVMNYLPAAANAGAAIFPRIEVRAIERCNGRWLVHVRVHDRAFQAFGAPDLTIQADAVFLGAGTLGSVEILLRSQRRGLSLSPHLGRRFSGNGDVIAFAYNAPDPVNGFGYGSYVPRDAAVGPLIAGMLDERTQRGTMLQEGTVPGALTSFLRFAAPVMARVSRRPLDLSADVRFRFARRELDTVLRGVRHGALRRTQTFLGMGRDGSAGVMRLKHDRLRIHWPKSLEGEDDVIGLITNRMGELTKGMKARYLVNPFWSRVFGRRRVTVHPLGGACMADDAERGVVNADGQVFAGAAGTAVHDGLYVCDGAVMPVALGTNPALTISAIAERIVSVAAEPVTRLATPEMAANVAHGQVRPSVPGIHYAERLSGRMWLDDKESRFRVVLHISAENLGALIDDSGPHPQHRASVVGVLTAPDLPEERRHFTVSRGSFNVMVDDDTRVDSKLVKYAFTLTARDGTEFTWRGQKAINHDTGRQMGIWQVVSRYPFELTRGGKKVGHGIASSSALDAVRMVASMRITHERRWLDRQIFVARYRWFFLKALLKVLMRSLTPPVDPLADVSDIFPLPGDIKEAGLIKDNQRSGRPRFKLVAYESTTHAPDKGAVILAPGFGMSAQAFLLTDSLTQHLCSEGYKVWLLDYRASDRLAASLEQFSIDELAIGDGTLAGDFPDAIARVVKENAGQPVQVVAHCVASLTMFMALLKGTVTDKQVKSVVLSQSFACINHPWLNQVKAWIQLPQFLRYMQFVTVMTPDYDLRSGWRSRLLDRLLRLYPTNERCSSGVCRRLLLMYGEVIRHDQLDKKTHDVLHHLFDRANMTTFVHLSQMIKKGRIVDQDGHDTYLTPDNTRRINVPIMLLQGKGNRLFKPRGGQRTIEWLHRHGGHGDANKKWFTLTQVPGHGHLDTFIGKNAKAVVYPIITELLAGGATVADGQRV